MDVQFDNAAALILAGGRARRMAGISKADLKIGEKTFLEHKIKMMSGLFSSVIVSVPAQKNPAQDLAEQENSEMSANEVFPENIKFVRDTYPGVGPLMGLMTTMKAAQNEFVFVSAVDAPFTNKELIMQLVLGVKNHDAHVPIWNGYPEPLCAVYRTACAPYIEKSINAGLRKVISFYDDIDVHYMLQDEIEKLDPGGRSFVNINTEQEYRTWIRE